MTLDWTLSFKQHLLNIAAKTTKLIGLMKRLASSHWGADFTTLRTVLALCFSVAEYSSPVWCHSSHCHKLDSSLNECLRLISGCIKSTPTYLLPVLCGIEPADIWRNKNCINLYKRAANALHILHNLLHNPAPAVRLKSRNLLTSRVQALANGIDDTTSLESWAQSLWRSWWNNVNHQLQNFISVPTPKPPWHDLRRKNWVLLNRIHSGHGRYACFIHKTGARDNPYCNCGDVQTPQHVLNCSVIGIKGDIINVDEEFRNWLDNNVLDI